MKKVKFGVESEHLFLKVPAFILHDRTYSGMLCLIYHILSITFKPLQDEYYIGVRSRFFSPTLLGP